MNKIIFRHFIGVDISRNKLDIAVMKEDKLLFHKVIKNVVTDISSFLKELNALPKFKIDSAVFCMEQTGFYGNHLLTCLQELNAHIVADNPLHIKRSHGIMRAKSDQIDAIHIAKYVFKNRDNLRFWKPKRPVIDKLAALSTLRDRLITLRGIVENPLEEQQSFVDAGFHAESLGLCKASRLAVAADVKKVDRLINQCIKKDPRLKHLAKIITSVPGVGITTTIQVIITTNEFLTINDPKKFACYAGIAPFPKESGVVSRPYKISRIANRKMKSLLHMCAVSARRCVPEINAYYVRKTEGEGKPKMAVLNAIRGKLILRIFTCVKQDRLYQADYNRADGKGNE